MRHFSQALVFLAFALCAAVPASAAVDVAGIDVSHWQGSINWSSVKNAGYKFAFMKATQGNTYVDPTFATNAAGAKAQGIAVGMYHFCDLDTDTSNPQDPVNEANHFLNVIKPYYRTGQYLPPVADVEGFPAFGSTAEAQAFTSTWVTSFSNTIYNALGVRPIIYTSLSKANSYYNSRVASVHELWLAQWKGTGTTSPPTAGSAPNWGVWQFWQWSDGADSIAQSSPVPGVSGNVDRDVFYGTAAQLSSLRIGFDGALAGDFNRDGRVDTSDYVAWRNKKGLTVPIYSGADANGDAKVDDADYALWRVNLGKSAGAGTALSNDGAVPEPPVAVLLMVACAGAWAATRRRWPSPRPVAVAVALVVAASAGKAANAQVASVSAWDAADFRSWSFIPYWTLQSQVNSFATDRVYDHLSDIVYHSGVQPRADGSLFTGSTAAGHLAALKNHQAQFGFRYHLDMFDTVRNSGESAADAVERVWNAISSNPTTRATFINNVKNVLTANNMTGFNFDWERPNTVAEWGNYTQLAREMQAAFPEDWEVSVDDYGNTDSRWDDSPLFDARVYDQIGMMAYHYPASNQQTFANGKKALTAQGVDKAFKDSQIIVGMGTWGASGPATVTLKNIVAVNPNLPPDASSFTGTVPDVDGIQRTGTWDIVSRYEVRDNVQLVLDRGMAGVMWWALSYDATNQMSLAKVAQHYAMVKRDVPDITLDGKVNATDAITLANNMGLALTNTGMATPAQFEAFYQGGNWEKGDHDGNGFVNQVDADWLKGRYTALGVALPDRLAFTGTFENFAGASGIAGRWQMGRDRTGAMLETANITQHGANYLSWTGSGAGASRHSNQFVTIRNQTATEAAAATNNIVRTMQADLSTSIDLGQSDETYVTFLVRENTTPLSAAQLASNKRTLTLNFLNSTGSPQFDLALRGLEHQFGIDHVADSAGQDTAAAGFNSDTTYLFLAKISGNGSGANTIQASLVPSGSLVSNFTLPDFQWMLTAQSSDAFNPIITDLQFVTQPDGNFTISNIWTGSAATILPPTKTSLGDFDQDGMVTSADYVVWRNTMGQAGAGLAADANGDSQVNDTDLAAWAANFGSTIVLPASASAVVPEPASAWLMTLAILGATRRRPRV